MTYRVGHSMLELLEKSDSTPVGVAMSFEKALEKCFPLFHAETSAVKSESTN